MTSQLDTTHLLALAAALGWASGLRLYLVLFAVGMLGRLHVIALPPGLELLTHTWVLSASGFMLLVEFLADKVPWIDSVWDSVHTFIRIPAGAALAASVMGEGDPATTTALAIMGGTLAAGAHFTKAGARTLINASPEPFTNWAASFSEELLVGVGLYLAIAHPLLFALLLIALIALAVWLLPRIWRAAKMIVSRITGWFTSRPNGEHT
jgi:hypothetical protein